MVSRSNKSIWTLVSGSVLQTNPTVLESELSACDSLLSRGLLFYKNNTKQSAEALEKNKNVPDSWKGLVGSVGKTLGLDEGQSWDLICSYLASEFRGTQESLKDLIQDEQKRKPLILDIWQFYRAERLYLLQIIKQILTLNQSSKDAHNQSGDVTNKVSNDFAPILSKVLKTLDSGQGGLRACLTDQLTAVTKEKEPETEALGPSLGATCRNAWIHFNLRETSELLQILLISLYVNGFVYKDVETVTEIFFEFGFGTKLPFKNEFDENNTRLVKSIGYLSITTLIYMLDLPALSADVQGHKIWGNPEHVTKMERLISGLGNHPSHSPALLAWTLSCFLAKGAEGLGKAARLGEMALANRVLKTLELILCADFNSHTLVSDIIHLEVYSVVSVLLSVFDPVSMGLQTEIETLANILLKHRSVAAHFWKQGPESGLAFFFQEMLQNFPRDFVPVIECLTSLASASSSSCQRTVATLSSLDHYTERVEDIHSKIGRSVDGSIDLLEDRLPYQSTKTIWIPERTKGELLENGSVRWRTQINGWQILLAECGELYLEISRGEEQVRSPTLNRVTKIANLVAKIISSEHSLAPKLEEITTELGKIAGRFCQVSHPPLNLLAGITQTFASITRADKSTNKVLEALKKTGLVPHFSLSHSLLHKSSATLVPGVVGILLASEETVSGEYPLLLSFLNLLKESASSSESEAGIVFVCREVLPNFSNWRYQIPGEREEILQLSLAILLQFVKNVKQGPVIVGREQRVCGSLLYLVSTGDRTIQSLLENQVSWEQGRGTDFCKIVNLALNILDRLLTSGSSSGLVLAGPVGGALRAPPSGPQSHLILTLAQYSYFFHDPAVATAAIHLMGSLAGAAARANDPVSMLACLGNSASSVKDLLLTRLESPLEDIRLKIAIVDLLTQCVSSQPGMIQLLLDINTSVTVVDGPADTTAAVKNPRIVGEGCLGPTLDLLAQCKDNSVENWQKLHLSVVKLVYNLWDTNSLLATRFIKDEPNFWKNLCWPISDPVDSPDSRRIKVKAYILRILANEIYTWKGKVTPELSKVLDRVCDEKSKCMENWCTAISSNNIQERTMKDDEDDEEEDEEGEPANVDMFLISSWRIFLLVLSKDYPVSVSPASCRSTYLASVDKLLEVLGTDPPPVRLTVLLAETATVLIKRWQTKCTDNMETLVSQMTGILEVLLCSWSSLLPRARLSILALALSTLRVSQFKLEQDQESSLLRGWLSPAVKLLALSFRDVENNLANKQQENVLPAPELSISLLQTLISRITQDKLWLSELHCEATLQLLLSAAGTCCRHKAAPSFVRRILQLLVEVAATPTGAAALLVHELAQELWLPLSDLPGKGEWEDVCLLGLELGSVLLRTGRTNALQTAITAMALLSDKLVADLIKPRSNLSGLSSAASVARFISYLSHHVNTWRSEHQASLLLMYRCCCSLLQYCTALLMRPVLLASMVKMNRGCGTDEDVVRCRRVSTASCGDLEVETIPPEAVSTHTLLLDICLSCLSLLLSLSPGLPALLTGDALIDPERWEPLLAVSFNHPTLEQEDNQLSYGTILALANTCVRSMARENARSPSPGRSSSSNSRPVKQAEAADKRRLTLLLEKCLVLVLCQSILTLSHSLLSPRDKQLLRRELGAELGSITDTWRRQVTRGGAKSPRSAPSPARGRSPQPPTSPQPPQKQKQDDLFIKFISNLVGNVFK